MRGVLLLIGCMAALASEPARADSDWPRLKIERLVVEAGADEVAPRARRIHGGSVIPFFGVVVKNVWDWMW